MPARRFEAVFDERDRHFMAVALELAARGRPAPNPQVGAVVVRHGKIVGSGYHEHAGGPHAEVLALQQACGHAFGSTVYVTLEPCNHFGRTPPCVEALRRAGVKRVVFGCRDPNHLVEGGGAERLRALGIETAQSALEDRARNLIAHWATTLPA